MASPIGHALAGLAIGRGGTRSADPRLWLGCAALAVAPDLDFVPGIALGRPALFHQSASHSLFVAIAVGGVASVLLFRDRESILRAWLLFSLAYASHLLLDAFGPDRREPIGIPLFWPLSDATFLAPFSLLPGIQHAQSSQSGTADWLARVFSLPNLRAIGLEVLVTGPFVLLAEWWHRSRVRDAAPLGGRV